MIFNRFKNLTMDIVEGRGKVARALWSLGDQAIVSAANFLVLFFVARGSTTADVGIYAVALSIVVILISTQEALITRPYTIRFFDSGLNDKDLAGSAFLLTLLFSAIACSVSLLFYFLQTQFFGNSTFALLGTAISFAIPFALLRQFIRRFLLAIGSLRELFFFDLFCIALMFSAISYLFQTENLNVVTVFWAMGGAYFLGFASWLVVRFRQFSFNVKSVQHTCVLFWSTGKWLLPTRVIREFQGYMTHWFSIVLLSASATGVFAANLSIVALSNPFVIGLLNIMMPGAVRVYKDNGMVGLRNQTIANMLVMFLIMVSFYVLIFLFGDSLIGLLFPDQDYRQNSALLLVLAAAISIGAISSPISVSLVCSDHAKEETRIYFYVCALSLFAVPLLIALGGLTGASCSVLFIETAAFIARLRLLMRIFKDEGVAFNGAVIRNQIARFIYPGNNHQKEPQT